MRNCDVNRSDRSIVTIKIAGKVKKRGFSYDHRSHMNSFISSFTFPKSISILQAVTVDEKYKLELKRGYYSEDKAKKYFS